MTTFFVSSGQTSSGLLLQFGDELLVMAGGSAVQINAAFGAQIEINSGGTARGDVIDGGRETISLGGAATSTTVQSGAQDVLSGGTASSTTVDSGAIDYVAGFALGGVVAAGGTEIVQSGGIASGIEIASGGILIVQSGGHIYDLVVDPGGIVTSFGVFLYSGGALVSAAPVLSDITVGSGEQEYVLSGRAVHTLVESGGAQFVSAGGITQFTTVGYGGSVVDKALATSIDTVVLGGGYFYLDAGMASGTVISSGGMELISGGHDTSGFVGSGGTLSASIGFIDKDVISGGVAYLIGTDGTNLRVEAGGSAFLYQGLISDLRVESGGFADVGEDTTLSAAVVSADGYATISRAVISGLTIQSAGSALVESAYTLSGVIVQSGGTLVALPGVMTQQVTVDPGGTLVDSGVIIFDQGRLLSADTGTVSGATIGVGVTADIIMGGVGLALNVSGGQVIVFNDGVADSNNLIGAGSSAALEIVSSGGLDSGTIIGVSATQGIDSGGVGLNEIVFAGGAQGVDGTAYNVLVESGGMQSVSGSAVDTTVLTGGTIYVQGEGATFGAVLSGGREDAFYFTDVYATTIDAHGTLFLTSAIALGTIINSGGEEFVGTFGDAESSVISSGGLQFVQAGGGGEHNQAGVAVSTTILSGGEQYLQASYEFYGGRADNTWIEAGGTLDVGYQAFVSGTVAQFDAATDVLVLSGGGMQNGLQLSGDYTGEYFALSNDGAGGTDVVVVEGTPCYCRGSGILTDRGEIAVEDLRIGDRLITKSGDRRALRWIGRRSYAGRFAAGNRDVLPVLFRAGSLGGGLPRRDLAVSPLHAMYLEGVLIPAACLVNGDTILQVQSVDQIDYFHLELDSHDVIIAEGALSESYIDDDNRGMFHNSAEHAALYPGVSRIAPAYCAPRVEDGDALHAIRGRLHEAPLARSAPLRGNVDLVERHRVAGWAMGDDGAPVRLRVVDNGVVLCELTAELPRPDVRDAVGGDGRCGFNHIIEGGLAPGVTHIIQVQRACDGQDVSSSPWRLETLQHAPPIASFSLRGCLDEADRSGVQGWAHAGTEPVDLQILDNGVLVGRVLANRYRADLADAERADGRCAFAYRFVTPLSPALRHVIEVRRASDGAALENSPLLVEAADAFDSGLQDAVAHAVAAIADQDRDRVLSFLLAQTDRLKQRTADAQAHRTERDDFWQFRRRWGAAPDANPSPALRALVIDRDLPTPDRDAGSQAIVSHMQALQRLGYEVSFVAAEQLAHTAHHLASIDIINCAAPTYASVEDVLRRQSGCFDLIYLHRSAIAETYMALCRRWMPKARIVYAVADLHHLRLARQAEIEQRPELHAQSRRLRLAECTAAWHADAVITHSDYEATLLRQAVPQADVHVVPWHVPLRPIKTPFGKRRGLAFIANYAHEPNVDAARFLVEEIMPLVWVQDPSIECHLAGSAMPPVIRALAAPGVTLLGHVADLATLFSTIRLTVAPLRYGAGIKGKVLDSLAAGIPCAATAIAAEGLDLRAAGDPEQLATLILRLHNDQSANRAATRAGRTLIETTNSTQRVDDALGQAIANAMRRVA